MTDDARRPGRRSASSGSDSDGSAPADALAPVIPLFGARTPTERASSAHPASRTRSVDAVPVSSDDGRKAVFPSRWSSPDDERSDPAPKWARPGTDADASEESPDDIRDRAEAMLLRRLRGRSLSLAEARTALGGVEGVDDVLIDEVLAKFVDLGYLNDEAFAEQLAMSAVERRGQGRRAVVQTLRKRGISREVADAAIAELPDDDAERALEFARSKARSVGGKDYDASLRRLAGQLARRGYSSSVSLDAARQALAEAGVRRAPFSRPAPSSGVRFTPDE